MFIKVFFLGRPGSGKSTAARHMIELAKRRNYSTLYMKDYDILYQMFQEDRDRKQFRPADYGGFDVLDNTVFDIALEQLERDILAIPYSEKKQLMIIEFARDDYRTALNLFSPAFLQDSYILFVDADLSGCISRIHKRVETPSEPDHHYVSDYIMQTYYNKDNWMYVSSLLKKEYPLLKKVVSIENTGLLSDLLTSVGDFAEMVFQNQFDQQEKRAEYEILNANSPDHSDRVIRERASEQSIQSADMKSIITPLPSSSTSYKQYTGEPRSGLAVQAH